MADAHNEDESTDRRSQSSPTAVGGTAPPAPADLSAAATQSLAHALQAREVEIGLQNQALQAREATYQELYEQYVDLYNFAPLGYAVLDREGRVLEANLTLARLLGVVRARIVGALLADFVRAEDRDHLDQHLRSLYALEEAQSWRLKLRAATGGDVTCHVDAQPLSASNGRTRACRLALIDITPMVEIEALRVRQYQELQETIEKLQTTQERLVRHERMSAIGQLAAGVAHDFNNILASILLYGQMIQRSEGLQPAQRRWAESLVSESRRGAELVQQIVDFGQRTTLRPERFSLVAFVQDVTRLLARTLPDSIDIRTVTDDELLTVDADRARLQQALVNLALNARDAMPFAGTLTLTVDRGSSDSAAACAICDQAITGRWVTIGVADSGHGIAPDILPHIFEPFFTTRSPEGHGLGLAQVVGIVAQHGGHLTVETAVGVGSTFRIYLPAVSDRVSAPSETEAPVEDAVASIAPLVLVVEDNPMTRVAVVEALTVLGYRTEIALHGREALDMLLQPDHGIDLILSDWIMPQMGGEELLVALRGRSIEIPVIVLSGYPMHYLDQGPHPAVTDWLQKPIDLNRLSRAIVAALSSPAEGAPHLPLVGCT